MDTEAERSHPGSQPGGHPALIQRNRAGILLDRLCSVSRVLLNTFGSLLIGGSARDFYCMRALVLTFFQVRGGERRFMCSPALMSTRLNACIKPLNSSVRVSDYIR